MNIIYYIKKRRRRNSDRIEGATDRKTVNPNQTIHSEPYQSLITGSTTERSFQNNQIISTNQKLSTKPPLHSNREQPLSEVQFPKESPALEENIESTSSVEVVIDTDESPLLSSTSRDNKSGAHNYNYNSIPSLILNSDLNLETDDLLSLSAATDDRSLGLLSHSTSSVDCVLKPENITLHTDQTDYRSIPIEILMESTEVELVENKSLTENDEYLQISRIYNSNLPSTGKNSNSSPASNNIKDTVNQSAGEIIMTHHQSLTFTQKCLRCLWFFIHNRITTFLVRIPTVADSTPYLISEVILSHPKSVFAALLLSCIFLDLVIILPGYILSRLITEWGVYLLILTSIWSLGRFILQIITFPGSTSRVRSDIENEFTKYSIRMMENAMESIIDLCNLLASLQDITSLNQNTENQLKLPKVMSVLGTRYGRYDLIPLWRKTCTYRDRVLGMYFEVLQCLLCHGGNLQNDSNKQTISTTSSSSSTCQFTPTKYGNNPLVGDIGSLRSISAQAETDGRHLYQLLQHVLDDLDSVEETASDLLNSTMNSLKNKSLSHDASCAVQKLIVSSTELKNFLPSLQSSPRKNNTDNDLSSSNQTCDIEALAEDEDDENLDAEQDNPSISNENMLNGFNLESIKYGIFSVIKFLDPPPHRSIFGLDVLRGTMLSRYKDSRQLWIPRRKENGGGYLDVIHIPSFVGSMNNSGIRNDGQKRHIPKAVLFCHPNAGLSEVATGISILGGNVSSDTNSSCWTDFYIENGYDIFFFNYVGYGRSYAHNKDQSDNVYTSGAFQIIKRIIWNTCFKFKTSPSSIKADALTVGLHLYEVKNVDHLVIHGESIGGMAAASTACAITTIHKRNDARIRSLKLVCDRTFCNLNAAALRLVGNWTGMVIPILSPFWSSDVAGDFLTTNCKKLVAQDATDAIIHDSSSLKAGISLAKEFHKWNTKNVGGVVQQPIQYRMADYEDVAVNSSKYITIKHKILKGPSWPTDKLIDKQEALHFAACARRIGKVATKLKRKEISSSSSFDYSENEGIEITQVFSRDCDHNDITTASTSSSESSTLFELWESLALCDNLTGMPLGIAVKEGCDCVLTWLSCATTFGSQRILNNFRNRTKESSKLDVVCEVSILPQDFECISMNRCLENNPLGIERPMQSLPTVLKKLETIFNEKEKIESVEKELEYCISMLRYLVNRITAQATNIVHEKPDEFDGFSVGSFLNLTCGHNTQYSSSEKESLLEFLMQTSDGSQLI